MGGVRSMAGSAAQAAGVGGVDEQRNGGAD